MYFVILEHTKVKDILHGGGGAYLRYPSSQLATIIVGSYCLKIVITFADISLYLVKSTGMKINSG